MDVEWNNFVVVVLPKALVGVQWNIIAIVPFLLGLVFVIPAVIWRENVFGVVCSIISTASFNSVGFIWKKEEDIIGETTQRFEELNKKFNEQFHNLHSEIKTLKENGWRVKASTTSFNKKVPKIMKGHLKTAVIKGGSRINADNKMAVTKKIMKLKRELKADVKTAIGSSSSRFEEEIMNNMEVLTTVMEDVKVSTRFVKDMEEYVSYIPIVHSILHDADIFIHEAGVQDG